MSLYSLTQARIRPIEPNDLEVVTPALEPAIGEKGTGEADAVSPIHHINGRDQVARVGRLQLTSAA